MRRWINSGFGLLLMAASAVGVYNVACDNADVERLAQEAACGGGTGKPAQLGCTAQKTKMVRTPWDQSFDFVTAVPASKKQGTATVHCMRNAVLVGEYACQVR